MENKGIGEKLRELRERQGLKVSEVARRAGITISGVTSIETGRVKSPGIETLFRLASAMGVDPITFLQEEGKPISRHTILYPPTIEPQGRVERALQRSFADIRKEARHATLEDLEHVIQYALSRAEYWEKELERGRTKEYATYNSVYRLAVLAVDEFSSFNRWLLDHGPAGPLLLAMEREDDPEIEDEYDALIEALIERTTRTKYVFLEHVKGLAKTEAQKDEIAAKCQEMGASAQLASRFA